MLGLRGVKGFAEGLRTCVFFTRGAVLEAEPVVTDEVALLKSGVVLSVGVELLFVADTGVPEASVFVMGVCICCCCCCWLGVLLSTTTGGEVCCCWLLV